MKKWLHLIPNAVIGGTEKDCLYIIEALTQDHHEVWVLDKEGPMSGQWQKAGALVKSLNILSDNPVSFYLKLKDNVKNIQADGIFCWSITRLSWLILAFRRTTCKMAVHVGNPLISTPGKASFLGFLMKFIDPNDKICLFACSQYVKNSLSKDPYYSKFECRVSLNPVQIPSKNYYHARDFSGKTNPRMGMVARIDNIKDHETVIRAFKFILKVYPDAILDFIGDGILRKKCENLASDLGIRNNVIFKGTLTGVYEAIREWDIFLYSTTQKEGLGNAVSEALANGIPVVASDLPMIREIDGGTGCISFVIPGNSESMTAMAIRLLNDPGLRVEKSKQSYERAVEAFSKIRYAEDRLNYLLG